MNPSDQQTDPRSASQASGAGSASGAEIEASLARIGEHLRALWRESSRYLALRSDQLRLRFHQFVIRVGLALGLGAIAAVLAMVAGWFLINGLAGGFAAWLESAWLGQLLAGVTMLVLIALSGFVYWQTRETARLRRLQQKYAAETDSADTSHASPVTGGDR